MTTMYVLLAGVTDVGFSVRGVFSNIGLARAAALAVPYSSQKFPWVEFGCNRWRSADEYVCIEEHPLNEDYSKDRPIAFEATMGDDKPKYFQDNYDAVANTPVGVLSDLDLINIWQEQAK